MTVLVTGFDPFGGESSNPAFEAVRLLPNQIAGAQIVKMEIPTEFIASQKKLEEGIRQYHPQLVISVGQAGGRAVLTPEQIAINLADARIPDNAGYQPVDQPLQADGPAAYFATVPVKKMVESIRSQGIPAAVSYTAGTYVCNAVMYHVQHLIATRYPSLRAGFIHVPFSSEQAVSKSAGTPSMPVEMIARGLQAAIEAVITE